MKHLTRKEIIEGLARQGFLPCKFGIRVIIDMVKEFEIWQRRLRGLFVGLALGAAMATCIGWHVAWSAHESYIEARIRLGQMEHDGVVYMVLPARVAACGR